MRFKFGINDTQQVGWLDAVSIKPHVAKFDVFALIECKAVMLRMMRCDAVGLARIGN